MNSDIIIFYAVFYLAIACITGIATEKRSAIWWPILLIKNIFRVLIWISKALVEAIKD
jgi:hypothetical protein